MAWINAGIALASGWGKFDDSLRAYEKAIEIDPRSANAWNGKGEVLRIQGKYDEANKAYDKAIELNPQNAAAWYFKGVVLQGMNRNPEADFAFNKSEELGWLLPRPKFGLINLNSASIGNWYKYTCSIII